MHSFTGNSPSPLLSAIFGFVKGRKIISVGCNWCRNAPMGTLMNNELVYVEVQVWSRSKVTQKRPAVKMKHQELTQYLYDELVVQ
jgi:hypothetical protein